MIIVTGAAGLLGGWVVHELERLAIGVLPLGHASGERRIELTDEAAVNELLATTPPRAVIHCAALSAVGDCHRDPERARAVNVLGTRHLARACAAHGARLVHVSTDMVFDGESAPYAPNDEARPLSVYGTTKLEAEAEALAAPDAVVVRASLLFGPTRTARRGLFDVQIEALRERQGQGLTLFADEWRTPVSLRAAAEALVFLARSEVCGTLHLGGPERLSRLEMGQRLARHLRVAAEGIGSASRLSVPGEPRAKDLSLDASALRLLDPALAARPFEDECAAMGI